MPGRSVLVVEQGGRGGVADYTAQLVRALAAEGVGVELATASDHTFGALGPGVRVRGVFGYLRGGTPARDALRRVKAHKLLNSVSYAGAIVRLLPAARRARVVHVQGFEHPRLVLLTFALFRLAGARIVHTPHNTFDRESDHGAARERMLAASDALIVHTRFDLGQLPPAAAAHAHVIPHGDYGPLAEAGGAVDPAAARRALGLPLDALVVLCFGQLRRDKGIDDVLRAARDVPGTWVLLAGEDAGALAACAPLLGERVVVRAGFQTLEQAAEAFAACDVSALAYRHASMSGVLLLGYGFARPPVVYPVGGLPEAVVAGETGWVCASSTVAALAATLRDVAAAGPQERTRRGLAGRALARERYAWPAIARATAVLYAPALRRAS